MVTLARFWPVKVEIASLMLALRALQVIATEAPSRPHPGEEGQEERKASRSLPLV